MLFTSHVLAGAAIGAVAHRPVDAFVVGAASHLVMDVVPHWGDVPISEVLPIARADGLVALAVGAVALAAGSKRRGRVLAGMLGAGALDLDKPCQHFFGASPYPATVDAFHNRIQVGREAPHRMPRELAMGAALAVLSAVAVGRRAR